MNDCAYKSVHLIWRQIKMTFGLSEYFSCPLALALLCDAMARVPTASKILIISINKRTFYGLWVCAVHAFGGVFIFIISYNL